MIEKMVFLASASITDFLNAMSDQGFFAYVLPFLLIFALVFGILNQIKIFKESKGVNGIIALVVGLLALQFDLVPRFFSEIFPRVGIAISVILAILIILGLFIDTSKPGIMYTLLGVSAVILIIVLINSAGALGWSSGGWWSDNWGTVAVAIFILAAIGVIIGASSNKPAKEYKVPWGGN